MYHHGVFWEVSHNDFRPLYSFPMYCKGGCSGSVEVAAPPLTGPREPSNALEISKKSARVANMQEYISKMLNLINE